MLVKFGKQERPRKIVVDEKTISQTFARFIAEPFERVLGHSIGNALRRILLSSLETPGVIAFRLEDVPHEFMAVEGIAEDVTNIVLNVKGILLRALPSEESSVIREARFVTSELEISQEDLDKAGGQVLVTAGQVFASSPFEVVNPDHHLFTITKPMSRQIDFRVGFGKGYVSSERHQILNKMVGEIVVDTAFSPVVLANYYVENTRVGQDTDYDRLVLDITTDKRLTPSEALSFAVQVLSNNLESFGSIHNHVLCFDSASSDSGDDDDRLLDKLCLRIDEIELSVRSTNCLSSANIDTIAELVCIPEKRMLEFRNFGKKSLNEIKAKLMDMGLFLGMDLQRFDLNLDNVRERVREISEERKSKKDKKKGS
ncbi:MAG: DNA-directed RNA polymerase subunit alpha [Chlamydia sp.]